MLKEKNFQLLILSAAEPQMGVNMQNKNYYIKVILMMGLTSPLLFTATLLITGLSTAAIFIDHLSNIPYGFIILPPIILLSLAWYRFCKKTEFPSSWGKRLTPVLAVFGYYIGLWSLIFGISQYSYDSSEWIGFFFLTLPYFISNFLFAFGNNFSFFPIMQLLITVISVLTMILTCHFKHPKAETGRGIRLSIAGALVLCLIVGFQYYDRTTKLLTRDTLAERVEDEVDLYVYSPFVENNLLSELPNKPAYTIDGNYPRLDGATAAYPVYAAMVQEIYVGLDKDTVNAYVECSKTDEAYERLINGEIDIFFGAQPSQQQIDMAKERGLEFELLPIAKEAFVFFVHANNPVDELSLEQIKDIYTKKIKNWKKLGGTNEAILPFQRPENSGSQTIMLAKVMQETPLPNPLREEYATSMGGVINQVAVYRNYTSSIGYSFRFFATGMKPNENIKLLAINGVEPSIENIRTNTYPFTIDVYAVTIGDKSMNTEKLLEWIISEEGQELIELSGYVRR